MVDQGRSTGLGRNLAQAVQKPGLNLAVSVRDPSQVHDIIAEYKDISLAVALDVANPAQVDAAGRADPKPFREHRRASQQCRFRLSRGRRSIVRNQLLCNGADDQGCPPDHAGEARRPGH